MYLLDSNTCIQFLNGRSVTIADRLRKTSPSEIVLCSVVKAELYFGAAKSQNSAAVLARLSTFFAPFHSIAFDDAAAAEYGQIRGALAAAGTPIGPNDLMIAAIALARGLTIVTHNVGEFSRVAALRIEDWETP